MKTLILVFFFILLTDDVWSAQYSARVHSVNTTLYENQIALNAEVQYSLSPTAKEALLKGISLNWDIIIKVRQQGLIWDNTLKTVEMRYQVQNHALLNLFSVKTKNDGTTAMFSSVTAALNSISKIQNLALIEKQLIDPGKDYHIAIKVQFKREALPVPLRPMSYFNTEWALSSPWSTWQIQN